ncbi:MAG: hypothetical protein MAG458_01730 [Nitrosopumilus sp.]|nr:hypothetical protein [Nitrosopumilus sp.]
MKIKICEHIDISQIRIEASKDIFTLVTIKGEKFATQSCKKCHESITQFDHKIISKEEFHSYL